MSEKTKIDITVSEYDNTLRIGKISWNFSRADSNISCGVDQIYNLPDDDRVKEWLKLVSTKDLGKAVINLFEEICNPEDEDTNKCRYLIISNVKHYRTRFNNILDKICDVQTDYNTNPNSGNNIKVWIYTAKNF